MSPLRVLPLTTSHKSLQPQMSLVHSTYFEATQLVGHPSEQFDMQTQTAPASHGPTKRNPTGDLVPVGQENVVHPSPTKRMCTSSSDDQGQHVLAPSGTSQSEAAHTFVDVLHQKELSKPGRTRSRSNAENISQVHAGSIEASPSLPGAFTGEPNAAADSSSQIHALSPERLEVVKGKQPDRRPKHKHEARPKDPAQQFLSLMYNLQLQMALHSEAQAAAQRPPPGPAPTGSEPQAEPEPGEPCARSRFGPVARYPGAMYESPFEGMLVKRTPWPAAAAAVMQEAAGCECSICVRARGLARRLEDGDAPPGSAAMLSMPSPGAEPSPDQPPALERAWAWAGGAPRTESGSNSNSNSNSNSGELRMPLPVESVTTAPSPGHRFFPHIQAARSGRMSNASHCQAEAGPSRPPTMRKLPPSGQDLFSMLFSASMAGLGSATG